MGDLLARLQSAVGDTYHIERELGGGGMSRLFLATESSLHRQVVLKVLPPEYTSEVSAARFRQEIDVAARLQHTNILPVLRADARDDLLYYVMPYVPGESLRHRLIREPRLPVADAVRILREIADALAYAHGEAVIHRDVKPENILLLGSHAVLTDFGVARALEASGTSRLTATGQGIGTPGYMPPEQLTGDRGVDERVDVYALAVVGYEMLAGGSPFGGPEGDVLTQALVTTPRPLQDARPDTPASVAATIARALIRDPRQRLRSATEFRDSLAGDAPSRRAHPAAFIAAVAIVVGLGAFLLFPKGNSPLNEDLIAIAPFDVVSRDLSEYREGLTTILSRTLDGAGTLRTLSPSIVVRHWSGRSDLAAAADFGLKSSAGLVLVGEVVAAGGDSARLNATLFDVRRNRAIGDIEVRDQRDRIDRIADTLAVRVLRELGRTRPVGVVRFAALGSSSLPAIKLFLQGEQFYRRGQYDSTLVYARRAVEIDSTFPLALRRIPNSLWWSDVPAARPIWLRAGAANHGLAPRESLLVTIDSLYGALQEFGSAAEQSLLKRLAATTREVVKKYPEDPEAWYMRGEITYHLAGSLPTREGIEESFDAFLKAVELDSTFGPAYEHIVTLAVQLGALPQAREYAARFTRLFPQARLANTYRPIPDLLNNPEMLSGESKSFFDTASALILWLTWSNIHLAQDSAEAAIVVARAFTRSTRNVDEVSAERQEWELPITLAYRGHVNEARQQFLAHRPWHGWTHVVGWDLTLTGSLPAEVETEWLAQLLRDSTVSVFAGLPAWTRRGDTVALRRFEQLAAQKSLDTGGSPRRRFDNPQFWQYWHASVPAYRALARRDTTTALRLFTALPDTLCRECFLERLIVAQLLSARHRDHEAAQILEEPLQPETEAETVGAVLWALERGRVNERLGNRDRALEAYSFVAAVWRHADPELQPIVEEARAGLRRLRGERN
jgi:serine/threonine-protein kinase